MVDGLIYLILIFGAGMFMIGAALTAISKESLEQDVIDLVDELNEANNIS